MESRSEFDFDRGFFEKKIGEWQRMLTESEELKDKKVIPEKTYLFTLKNGKELKVNRYRIVDTAGKDYPYSDLWFLLGQVDGKVAGYVVLSNMVDNGAPIKMSTGDIAVKDKSQGIGSKLVRLREMLLQEVANERGDTDYVVMNDENAQEISQREKNVYMHWVSGDISMSERIEQIKKMLVDRQKWLSIYGIEGKSGYKWDEDHELRYKRYFKGQDVPEVESVVLDNNTDLRAEIVDKYSPENLRNLAGTIKTTEGVDYDPNADTYLNWVVSSLESGDIQMARVDYENQQGKFQSNPKLDEVLRQGLFDSVNLSPRDSWNKLMVESEE